MRCPSRRHLLFDPASHTARRVAAASSSKHADAEKTYLVRASRRAMACLFEIAYPVAERAVGDAAALAALDEISRIEAELSYFRPDSELSQANRSAGSRPVRLSRRLFDVLCLARSVWEETGGAYDVTSTPLSDCWGFLRREPRVPSEADLAAALARVGMGDVLLNEADMAVAFARSDLELNLNSVGKGLALDEAAARMSRAGVRSALLQAGGSSAVALGAAPGRRGWQIGIRHPLDASQTLACVSLRASGFSTSGAEQQGFVAGGKHYGHLLDPRTGRPGEGMLGVSVAAPTAALAEALSTAFFVMAAEATRTYCAAHPEVRAFLLPKAADGRAAEPVVVGFGPGELEVVY